MITALIRMSGRHQLFKRSYESILNQTYKDVKVIVSYDREEDLEFIPNQFEKVRVYKDPTSPAFYNLYCNVLKNLVTEGYFYFQDSDDTLASPTVLQELSEHLSPEHGTIVQFLRNNKPKPNDKLIQTKQIIKGRIGGGCLILHHSHKDLGSWDDKPAADYRFIKEIESKLPLKFVPLVVQVADYKNNGI